MKIFKVHNRFILFNIGHNSFDDGMVIWFAFRILGIGLELDFTTRKYFISKGRTWGIVIGKFYDSFANQYLYNSIRVPRTKQYK